MRRRKFQMETIVDSVRRATQGCQQGNTEIARELNISRPHLSNIMRRHGLGPWRMGHKAKEVFIGRTRYCVIFRKLQPPFVVGTVKWENPKWERVTEST